MSRPPAIGVASMPLVSMKSTVAPAVRPVLEIADGELEQGESIVRTAMADAAELSVPLEVSVGIGSSWHEAGH